MRVKVKNSAVTQIACDLLIVNLFEGETAPGGATGAVDKKLGGAISSLIRSGEISGKLEETSLVHTQGKMPAKQVLVVGLGKSAEFDLNHARIAASAAICEAKRIKAKKVATIVHGAGIGGLKPQLATQAVVEGSLLGAYEFTGFASLQHDKKFFVEELLLVELSKTKIKELQRGKEIGEIISSATNYARDLVNGPANLITPTYLATAAKKVKGLTTKIFDLKTAKKMGMEAYYSVSRGSKEPARFIVMQYGKGKPEVALVGKGITFDAGGISLKPSNKLWQMKTDMAGAAAVLAVMQIITKLKIRKNVVGIMPCTENMPDGDAQKPGDVVGSLAGKTIEIISTDAEGRMVMADGITYARNLGVKKIIDIATLTGACVYALGDAASGIMGNNQELIDQLIAAGKNAGEKLWQLPLLEEYKDYSKSLIADTKNCTEMGKASPSIGGLFLQLFAEDTAWAHVDIAGTAYLDKGRWYQPTGATGVMVRTLVEFLVNG